MHGIQTGINETDVCFLQVLPLQSNGTSVTLRLDRQEVQQQTYRFGGF